MDDNKNLPEQESAVPEAESAAEVTENAVTENDSGVSEYEGMSKAKANFFKALPLIITLTCVALFVIGVKWIASVFYKPVDTLYEKNGFRIVHCYENPSNTYYIYGGDFVFDEKEYENVANEHKNAHFSHTPLAYFILNESALTIEQTTVQTLYEANGVYIMQFGEFVLYFLEGQYGVFAPLRNYEQSATSRKNDLYIVRQLLKDDRYKAFVLPEKITRAEFLAMLEKIEWYLDTEYVEDN